MAAITTGSIPKAMKLGTKYWFGRQYNEHSPEYTDLFDVDSSSDGWEDFVELTGFGLVPVKDQGDATRFDAEAQGVTHRLTHVAYGLGFMVTREERDDNKYAIVGKRRSKALAYSFRQTKENVAALVYDRAFNSTYTGGDDKELCAEDHDCIAGSQANEMSAGADLSPAAVEDLCILAMKAVNSKGLKIALRPQSLHVHPNDYFEARRLYESTLQYDDANNAKNVLKGYFPKGVKVNHYFSDTDAFFIRTDCPEAMKFLQRIPVEFGPDNDFNTDNLKFKGYERYVCGWGDWRGVYGSPGA